MPVLSICPPSFDIFVCQGDELPWTFTLKGSDGSPIDITGYVFTLDVDELEHPATPSVTDVFALTGTVTDAVNGVVQFALDSLEAETAVGRYYYKLHVTNVDGQDYIAAEGRFLFVDSCETNKVSDVDICNMALGLIGDTARITNISPPDTSAQAQLCSKFYPIALRSTLEMHNWAFATRRSVCDAVALPAEDGHDHEHTSVNYETCDCSEWKYYYQLPRHFLKAISVYEDNTENDYAGSQDFSVQLDTTGVTRLYTNVENAVLLYTEYVVETHRFPPLFQAAVAWHLASLLAGPVIRGDAGSAEAKRCQQMMQLYLSKAKQSDSVNRSIKPNQIADWMANR